MVQMDSKDRSAVVVAHFIEGDESGYGSSFLEKEFDFVLEMYAFFDFPLIVCLFNFLSNCFVCVCVYFLCLLVSP
jgi:hypothetical protein